MSSSLSARAEQFPNPFMEQAQAVVEFSRGLSSALKGANHQRKDAFFQFFTRQLPKQAIRELVPEFNKAVREYNRNRNKLKAMLTRGDGIQPEDKLFTVEENLKNAMRTFQRIKDLLLVYPKVKNEPARATAMNATARAGVNILKAAGYALSTAIILASCAPPPAEVAPVPDQEDEEEKNPTQTAQDVIDGTQEGQEIDPATLEAPTVDPLLEKVETGLGSNPNSQTSYVRALEIHNNESMVQACLDFVKRLDNRIDINYNTIGINQYGICYAKSDDGSQIIFDKWDANGPLYVTRAAGFDLLSKLNPQATDGKTEEDFSLEENAANTFAVLKDDQGNLTEVGVGINGQWGTTGSTELVATPTAPSANSETDLEEENLLTSNPEVIASMVDDFANKKTEFPRDLNPEQYSAFIDEMNNYVGRKSIWVETNDGNVLYYDVKQNKMVSVPGTYEQNRDLIEQNQIELFVKIETDPETGNIQFVNSEGELVTSPNSADVDWNLVVDASNYKNGPIDFPNAFKSENSDAWYDKIIGGVSPHEIVQKLKQAFMPGILMDDIVCKIVQEQNGWKQYPCINIMFIKADKDGNPLYGIRTMVGGGPNIFVGEEGGEIDTSTTGVVELRDSDDIRKLETGSVYYVGAPINQDIVWQEANKSDIDALQGVGPESNKYTNISSENMPDDGNIVIAGTVLIKKK